MNKRDNKKVNSKTEGEKLEFTSTHKVNRSDELLEFLLKKLNTSRNNVKGLLSKHMVLVNGSVITQFNYPLAKDDEVKISKKPIKTTGGKPQVKKAPKPRITIIYEDDDFIAIDKPCGLLSVENEKERVSAYTYVSEYLQSIDKTLRPYVLHRIDKETSGVLVFAKNIKLHSMLKLKWNEFVQTREYIAIVEGMMEEKKMTIKGYLKETENNMVYPTKDPSGQLAITNYVVMKESKEFSMLKVKIDTGRKNQIRVHMQELGHPIVGDTKYGYNLDPLKRLGLHASKLEFVHPLTKELITISAKAPNIFSGLFVKR